MHANGRQMTPVHEYILNNVLKQNLLPIVATHTHVYIYLQSIHILLWVGCYFDTDSLTKTTSSNNYCAVHNM